MRRSSQHRRSAARLAAALGLAAGLASCGPRSQPSAVPVPPSTPLVPASCDPELDLLVRRSRVTYRVRGNSLDELRASMQPQRYRDSSGMAWDAYTWWQVRWSYPFVEQIGSCALGREQVAVEIRMHLPEWEPPAGADPELVSNWKGYTSALEAHEQGHAQIALAAACEIRDVLRGLSARSDCDQMERAADRATQAVINRYHGLEERYDLDTNHGASDGAVLP